MTGTRQRLLAVKTASTDGASIQIVLAHRGGGAMDSLRGRLAALVGRGVSVALVDGTRLDDCWLVSQPRARSVGTAWIVHGGDDLFVPVEAIADVWEASGARCQAA
jgi:hypothetical protein